MGIKNVIYPQKLLFENLADSKTELSHKIGKTQEWFTTKEAAEYLRLPIGTVRNRISNGVYKPRGRLGRSPRFHIEDLIELLTGK